MKKMNGVVNVLVANSYLRKKEKLEQLAKKQEQRYNELANRSKRKAKRRRK